MLNRHERRQSELVGISRKSAKRRTEENQSQSERSCIDVKRESEPTGIGKKPEKRRTVEKIVEANDTE